MPVTRISGADIKDKTPLMDARRAIEREMERFKLCEKEAKMQQFSKAALGLADKLDPREQAKAEARDWINTTVDSLNASVGTKTTRCLTRLHSLHVKCLSHHAL